MENNNKTIRVVSRNGKSRFSWAYEDAYGDVDTILDETLDMSFRSESEFVRLKEMLREATAKPVVHITNSNAKFYGLV